MIEIIKQGQTKFSAYCSQCGCEFTYELEDLDSTECVKCPCCGHIIVHNKNIGTINYPYGAIPCVGTPGSDGVSTNDYIKRCEQCDFYKRYLAGGKTYIGDSPCEWCQNYPYRVTLYAEASTTGNK